MRSRVKLALKRTMQSPGYLPVFIGLFGGPDRDRTDDLFHAMIGVMGQIIDGTVLTNWHNRQN